MQLCQHTQIRRWSRATRVVLHVNVVSASATVVSATVVSTTSCVSVFRSADEERHR